LARSDLQQLSEISHDYQGNMQLCQLVNITLTIDLSRYFTRNALLTLLSFVRAIVSDFVCS